MSSIARAAVLAAALVAAGCSFLVNTADRVQCSTDADCDESPALSGRICDQGFCALRPQTVSDEAGASCTSTDVCTQANSGRASVCKRAGSGCVPWQIDGCPAITGKWRDPNAIVVGSLLPLHLKQKLGSIESPYSKRLLRAIDLASEEIDTGAPQGFFVGGTSGRPIAVLHCDSRGDPDEAKAMFTHLTDVVGASAVIVGWDEDMANVAALAAEKKTAVVCSDCLAPIPPDARVWRILPPLAGDAALVSSRVLELEAQIKAQTPGDIRVAVLVDGAPAQRHFLDELPKVLAFNGVDVLGNGARYLPIRTPDPRTDFVDYDGTASQIAAFAPHIVIAAMASDFPTYHLSRIEGALAPSAPRPYYVLTQISYDAAPFQQVLADDALRARVSGTHPFLTDARRQNLARYESSYRASYKEAANGNSSGYEALYALALAIAARTGQPLLDGPTISAGFPSLVSGPTFDLGPGPALNTAISALRNGPIDIRGIYTDLDWNTATGEIASDMGLFCFGKEPDGTIVLRNVPTVRWSAATKQTTGSFVCPP